MRLIGSLMEQQFREELTRSNLALRDGSGERLAAALRAESVDLDTAYVLQWIPEQYEDVYAVIVSMTEVLSMEVPRDVGQVVVERQELTRYSAGLSKSQRIKIAVALDILKSKVSGPTRQVQS